MSFLTNVPTGSLKMRSGFDETVRRIFSDNGFPVFVIGFEHVRTKPTQTAYKTVLITYLPYYYEPDPKQNICIYAALRDYHTVFVDKLAPIKAALEKEFPGNIFEIFTDNSPIDEKRAAELSGLGKRGMNSLIITKDAGSFVFLGEILTDLELSYDLKIPERCSGCGECIRACPADAITGGRVDTERCISALTQKRGTLAPEQEELVRRGRLLWGCDVCQTVCPENNGITPSDYGKEPEKLIYLKPDLLFDMTNREFDIKYKNRAFSWRGKSVLIRNAKIIYKRENR